jgi:hypothetical protein
VRRRTAWRIGLGGLIPMVVLIGWATHLEELTSLAPNAAPMHPLVAFALGLSAISVWLQRNGRPQGWRASLAYGLAGLMVLIGALRLIDVAFGSALCPDNLQFMADKLDPAAGLPHHIAPLAASCLVFLGVMQLLLDRSPDGEMLFHVQWIGAPIVPFCAFALADYFFEGSGNPATWAAVPIAPIAAFDFLLLSLATWSSRSQVGPMSLITADNPGARLIRFMLPASCYLPLLLMSVSVFGFHHHWFTPEKGAALAVLGAVIAISTITITISLRLQVLDGMRRKTLKELKARIATDEATARMADGLMKTEEVLRSVSGLPGEAGNSLLSFLAGYTGVPQLCLYMLNVDDGEPHLRVLACHAYGDASQLAQHIPLGDGLAGQCALDQRPLTVNDVPKSYFRIRSGVLDTVPRQLVFLPLMVNRELVGVLELATLSNISEETHEFLLKAARIIAFAVYRLREQQRVQRLLNALASARERPVAPERTVAAATA